MGVNPAEETHLVRPEHVVRRQGHGDRRLEPIRRSAEIFLLQAGCTVILAEDGFDALAKITDHQPNLVFVDIMMPRLDGYQTCALIKKNTKFQACR
jgi:CheY-like chemotaxis protein